MMVEFVDHFYTFLCGFVDDFDGNCSQLGGNGSDGIKTLSNNLHIGINGNKELDEFIIYRLKFLKLIIMNLKSSNKKSFNILHFPVQPTVSCYTDRYTIFLILFLLLL